MSNTDSFYCNLCGILMTRMNGNPNKRSGGIAKQRAQPQGQTGFRPKHRTRKSSAKTAQIKFFRKPKRRPRRRPKTPKKCRKAPYKPGSEDRRIIAKLRNGTIHSDSEDTEKSESEHSQTPAYRVAVIRQMKRLGRLPITYQRRFRSVYVQVPPSEVKIKKEKVEGEPKPQQEPQPPGEEQKIQPQPEAERQQRAIPALPALEGEPNLFASTQNSVMEIKKEAGIGVSY